LDETIPIASASDDEDQLVGTLLDDRYEIKQSLDRGGMGTVYLAWDTKLERMVVVKIPHARLMTDRTFRLRFLQEIRDLANHEHPAILRIEGSGSHGDVPYAVVQYLRGGNLRERITAQGGQETPTQILEWLPTIADALDTVHKNGSLHRDVKPANILFDERDNAVLSDFGIATAIGAADPDAPTQAVQQELTVVGTFVGSPAYAPPEAIDRLLTPAYDQYSLATVVYLAITGELPFSGQTNEAILIAKERDLPPKIDRKRLKAPLSRSAEKAIMKGLSRKPEDRFESCSAFAAAFGGNGATAESSLPWGKIATAIAALTILVLAVTQIEWRGSSSSPKPPTTHKTDREKAGAIAVSSSTVLIQLGSHPEEIDRAISICKQGGGRERECAREVFADERLRTVTLTPFSIDKNEVTNASFARFSDETNHVSTAEERGYSWDITKCRGCNWRHPRPGQDVRDRRNDPVVHVSWADSQAYCDWAGSRLPSEDEWEFSARGKARRTYPWGDKWDRARVRDIDSKGVGLEPVGSHPDGATPEGIVDLAGSVWEWTSTASPSGDRQVFKGGSWVERNPAYLRSAAFSEEAAEYSSISLGFRCARDLPLP
jgi:serine/threonine protein kinase